MNLKTLLSNLWKPHPGTTVESRFKQFQKEVFELDTRQAKEQAALLLANPDKFRCVIRNGATQPALFVSLPSSLQELCIRYTIISWEEGDAYLDFEDLHLYATDQRFIVVGTDSDGTVILTEPGVETIYVTYGGTSEADLTAETYPSIYHWIILTDLDVYS